MMYDVNNKSKSDHAGELSPFISESKLTLSIDLWDFIYYYINNRNIWMYPNKFKCYKVKIILLMRTI